jgi:hypothetical protein
MSDVKFYKKDRDGNVLYVTGTDIKLYIKSENRHRNIAAFNPEERVIYITRKEKHKHIKSNSYGFNEALLNQSVTSTHIIFRCPEGIFKIPIKFIQDNGNYLHFAKQGFELQLFIPLEIMEEFRMNDNI